jgi:hypothetical protein
MIAWSSPTGQLVSRKTRSQLRNDETWAGILQLRLKQVGQHSCLQCPPFLHRSRGLKWFGSTYIVLVEPRELPGILAWHILGTRGSAFRFCDTTMYVASVLHLTKSAVLTQICTCGSALLSKMSLELTNTL